jgi:hypothetical protein
LNTGYTTHTRALYPIQSAQVELKVASVSPCSGVRVLPSPNGFGKYRDGVAAEVERRVERANQQAASRRGGLKERAVGRASKK